MENLFLLIIPTSLSLSLCSFFPTSLYPSFLLSLLPPLSLTLSLPPLSIISLHFEGWESQPCNVYTYQYNLHWKTLHLEGITELGALINQVFCTSNHFKYLLPYRILMERCKETSNHISYIPKYIWSVMLSLVQGSYSLYKWKAELGPGFGLFRKNWKIGNEDGYDEKSSCAEVPDSCFYLILAADSRVS